MTKLPENVAKRVTLEYRDRVDYLLRLQRSLNPSGRLEDADRLILIDALSFYLLHLQGENEWKQEQDL